MQTGDRIRELRLQRGMTQQELADAIGCSRPAVVLWESHTRQTPLAQLRKIAKILQAPLSELLGEWRTGEVERITDPAEQALVELYRQMPNNLRKKHLELFAIQVEIGEEAKVKRHSTKRTRVPEVNRTDSTS